MTLSDGAASLYNGTSGLTSGAEQLQDGANALYDGAKSLKSGTAEVNGGATSLYEGMLEFKDGVNELRDGVTKLHDGMSQFQQEGIARLTDLYWDNIPLLLDRLKALKALGEGYNSFSGMPKNADGTVKFLIRTEG